MPYNLMSYILIANILTAYILMTATFYWVKADFQLYLRDRYECYFY